MISCSIDIWKYSQSHPIRYHSHSSNIVVVTRWGSDPYALGSFSYTGVGANGEDYEELGKSVADRVFFAGEATNR